jgi:hypothetical protein
MLAGKVSDLHSRSFKFSGLAIRDFCCDASPNYERLSSWDIDYLSGEFHDYCDLSVLISCVQANALI